MPTGDKKDLNKEDRVGLEGTPDQLGEGQKWPDAHMTLASISHAFNYRVAVLRDGVKPAVRIGHSRKAERQFLEDVSIPWDQQVAVMFQIVSVLVLDVRDAAVSLDEFQGVSPNVLLACEPWGNLDHTGVDCHCLSSDRTGTCVHALSQEPADWVSPSPPGRLLSDIAAIVRPPCGGRRSTGVLSASESTNILSVRPGAIPFVSH